MCIVTLRMIKHIKYGISSELTLVRVKSLYHQITMSVCQALIAAGQVKDASTLRARTAVREKLAVAQDMS